MSRARVLALVAAVLLIAAAVVLWRFAAWRTASEESDKVSPAATHSSPTALTTAAPAKSTNSPGDAIPIHVRIPDGTPIAMVVTELKSAAETGNARAACRLAIELSKCQFLGSRSTAEEKAACEGVSANDVRQVPRYLWQSASAGNVAAMSRYARYPGLDNFEPAENAEAWLQYKQNAESFLARAVQGGDVMALYFSWWYAATGLSSAGRHMFPKDPYMAVVYGSAVKPLLDDRRQSNVSSLMPKMEASLTPDQIEKARAEGQRIRDAYFAGAAHSADTPDDSYVLPAQCDN